MKTAVQVTALVVAATLALILLWGFGDWLYKRQALCVDQVGSPGSQRDSALECETTGQRITIEQFGQSVVAVCRCP